MTDHYIYYGVTVLRYTEMEWFLYRYVYITVYFGLQCKTKYADLLTNFAMYIQYLLLKVLQMVHSVYENHAHCITVKHLTPDPEGDLYSGTMGQNPVNENDL